jgi:hypothetical protein
MISPAFAGTKLTGTVGISRGMIVLLYFETRVNMQLFLSLRNSEVVMGQLEAEIYHHSGVTSAGLNTSAKERVGAVNVRFQPQKVSVRPESHLNPISRT